LTASPGISYTYIDNKSALERLNKVVIQADRISVDTEADSLHHYFEKVCLIQLTINGQNYIVDPLVGLDLSSLMDGLSKKLLIFHGADYDLRMLRSSFGFRPLNGIYDTMVAARLLGFEQIGLAALVQRYFDVTLSKKGQKSNWSLRPLPEEQLDYAKDDTVYLDGTANRLDEELKALDRLSWHKESCQAVVKASLTDKPPMDPDEEWRIKGIHKLRRRELCYVREIWYWRENEARKADLPPFKIMGNWQVIRLSEWCHYNPGSFSLDRPQKTPKNIRGDRLKALKDAIDKADKTSEADWPKIRIKRNNTGKPLTKDQAKQVEALRDECFRLGKEYKVDPTVIASKGLIEAVVRKGADNIRKVEDLSSLMRWQADLLKGEISRILNMGAL